MTVVWSWLRVALIDLRGGLRQFAVLVACVAMGVGTIAMVGSVSAALQGALSRDARVMLGGDLEAQLSYREATAAERTALEGFGTVSAMIEVLGRASYGDLVTLLSLRGVEPNYPLLGAVEVAGAEAPPADLLAKRDGAFGLVVDTLALQRLGAKIGDRLEIGPAIFEIRGILGRLPDQVTRGIAFGVPALVSLDGLRAVDVLAPGVLARYRYKVLMAPGADSAAAAAAFAAAFPDAGWQVSTAEDATADLARFFDLFSRFLTLVGLTALLVGGVGVSNAVAAYLDDRQRSIATLKSLGATGTRVLVHFLAQVIALTAVGSALGLLLGGVLTWIALPFLGQLISASVAPQIDWPSLGTAGLFGLLCGVAFALLPLQLARDTRPAMLFRAAGSGGGSMLGALRRPGTVAALLLAAGAIFLLAVLVTGRPTLVAYYAAGIVLAFAALRLAAWLVQRGIGLLPPMRHATARNAIKSITRPGAHAPTMMLSLSLGLTLLVLISLVDHNLRLQLAGEVRSEAPTFVFMDLFEDEADELAALAQSDPRIESFKPTPIMRGALTAINGTPVSALPELPAELSFSSFFEGEVPISYSATVPEQSTVVSGEWWPADYNGEPLVSLSEPLREPLGVKLGDIVTFAIAGEELTARIASFREYGWREGNMNMDFVLTPNTADLFPVSFLGLMKTREGEEDAMQSELVTNYPNLLFLRFGDAIDAIAGFIGNVVNAIAAIGALALASGVLVLAGAMAAGRKEREATATVEKVLGATRWDILLAFLIEYGLLGVLSALLALILGIAGAALFVTQAFGFPFALDAGLVVLVLAGGTGLAIIAGAVTTWTALSVRPVAFLRAE